MTKNKKQRAAYGAFYLTSEDIASFRQKKESARAIAQRKGTSSSLVAYHLRKLNDPEINALLVINANQSSDDFRSNRLKKVERMLKRGCPSLEIINACHISTGTMTKVRKKLGLYDESRAKKKPGRPAQSKPGSYHDLIADVVDTPVFTVLTKAWPVNLEYEEEAA